MLRTSLLKKYFLFVLTLCCIACDNPASTEKKAISEILARDAKLSAIVANLRGNYSSSDVLGTLKENYEDRRGLISQAQAIKSAGSGDTEKLIAFLKLENLYCETLFEAGQIKASAGFSYQARRSNSRDFRAGDLVRTANEFREGLSKAEAWATPFGWPKTW